MSETLHEQLSALLDGELPPEETELLLKRLERDQALRGTLARYNLAGDVLRGDRAQASPRFPLKVSQAIAREAPHVAAVAAAGAAATPAVHTAASRRAPRWLQSVVGLATAAAVATVAVVVLQRDPAPGVGPGAGIPVASTAAPATNEVTAAAPAPAAVAPYAAPGEGAVATLAGTGEPLSYVTPPAPGGAVRTIPDAQLANYVVAHSEFSSPLGRRSVLTGLMVGQAPVEGAR
ncbi:MAG: sigma-E factor negative regulatory protein [Steroidobacteraceae bacterium]|nr:sigma-E factor negative regulatory protein [Steroidobacteraceae bacterium]